jgi:hypothetical protein
MEAIGRKGKVKGGEKFERHSEGKFRVPVFLAAENLKPFVTMELIQNSAPVHYHTRFGPNWGLRGEVLPGVCQVYLDAQHQGVLQANQQHIAEQCRILSRGFATVGLFALIDEATGAQDFRAANALAFRYARNALNQRVGHLVRIRFRGFLARPLWHVSQYGTVAVRWIRPG